MDPPLISKPGAVIFDLDGTLLDTEPLYSQAAQTVIDPFGKTFDLSLKRKMMGGDSRKSAAILIEQLGIPLTVDEFLHRREAILLQLFPSAPEIEGAGDFIRSLSNAAIPLGLATSSQRPWCDLKLKGREWSESFHIKICGDDERLHQSKPAPDIFLICARDLQVDATNCVAFEDSPLGIQSAIAAGMTVIAVNSPFVERSDLSDAALIVEDFVEAHQLLAGWS
ncbi:MAG: HAD-IA family hydrolase [Pseudomonadales bacterium]|jgi:pseudouridine-5'-monophosphatase|nr:HAD-IA family hydrolase [Pseudomonadales bacterium]MDP7146253.1 HAD-IA family hydrolase [Pseudomonadales bacterium]|tara:strand:+ start:15 stop:686 length:672 start_codon:yes stop_codon:yes gene_type:complete